MAVQLGKVLDANLPDEVKKRILWDNLVSILPAKAGLKPKAGDAGANPCEVMQ
jgi:hypothetical protein